MVRASIRAEIVAVTELAGFGDAVPANRTSRDVEEGARVVATQSTRSESLRATCFAANIASVASFSSLLHTVAARRRRGRRLAAGTASKNDKKQNGSRKL